MELQVAYQLKAFEYESSKQKWFSHFDKDRLNVWCLLYPYSWKIILFSKKQTKKQGTKIIIVNNLTCYLIDTL